MTDMTLNEACAVADNFGKVVKGLSRLQEAAEAFRGADQAIADRRRQAEATAAEVATAQAALAALTMQIEEASENAKRIASDAQSSATATLAAARDEAKKITDAASEDLEKARNEAQGVIARAAAADRSLKSAQAELAAVEARLEQAKAEARKIFGG